MSTKFKEFKVSDVFGKASLGKYHNPKTLHYDKDGYPYICASNKNNGVNLQMPRVKGDSLSFTPKKIIAWGKQCPKFTYHDEECVTAQGMYYLDMTKYTKEQSLYVCAALTTACKGQFGYSRCLIGSVMDDVVICLPVIESEDTKHVYTPDDINWQYMQDRIVELEQEHVSELEQNRDAELEAYFKATGLNDYELTEDDKHILASKLKNEDGKEPSKESEPLPEGRWWKEGREFYIADVFEIKNSKNILKSQVDFSKPEHPYLTAKEGNNSVAGYVSYDEDFLDEGNCVFIGGKTSTVTYQKDDFFSNDSHNLLLYPKEELSEETFLYLVSAVKNIMKQKYAWSNSVSYKKIQKDIFCLPIQTDDSGKPVIDAGKTYSPKGYIPDWDYMEKYIKATEKEIIKEVVLYKDEVIAKAKEITEVA